MNKISTEAKVGFVIFCALVIGVYFTLRIGKYTLPWQEKGYVIYSILDSIPYLEENAPVKYAGVKVGKVKSIAFYEGKAKVKLLIMPRDDQVILIPRDSIAYVLVPLLGESSVEIKQGVLIHIPIKPGEYIQGGPPMGLEQLGTQLSDVIQPLAEDLSALTKGLRNSLVDQNGNNRLNQIVTNLDKTLEYTNQVLEENKSDIREAMSNLRSATEQLDSILKKNKSSIESTLENAKTSSEKFSSLTDKLSSISDQLDGILSRRSEDIDTSLGNIKELTQKLKEILETVEKVVKKIDEGKGTVGKLINDENVYNELKSSMKTLDTSLKNTKGIFSLFRSIRGNVGISGEYLEQHEKVKSYFGVSVVNKSGVLLDLQIVDNPIQYFNAENAHFSDSDMKERQFKVNQEILFSLQVGKQWKGLRFRGGIIESSGGLGFDYSMFKERFRFFVDGWDWNREPDPHIKVYSDIRFYDPFILRLGYDDLLNNDTGSFLFGLGLQYP
ncbi:MAG: hypothetical protein A2161_19695 [Candidatus Schekmanbacteria bacterium RBG_13_48_7]|uniref:Mce/MlaD domain-containing protein n=1 Tax=Candidatus Schekmanbacteria bacterium RBG_13_48_7 TaxID=1817878 RepID=A0A1F7RML0_9BACT|nr:MAG: hypothetical protein A2161_19695 [Candidatus Schekmanbacteria bacterium RBG_13_48_7]